MKKLELLFYSTTPSEKNIGFKHVLIKITDGDQVKHDWGFAYWNGTAWDAIETPEDVTAEVVFWANTIDPEVLLKEESKIISL
jgi:hypothetical protein